MSVGKRGVENRPEDLVQPGRVPYRSPGQPRPAPQLLLLLQQGKRLPASPGRVVRTGEVNAPHCTSQEGFSGIVLRGGNSGEMNSGFLPALFASAADRGPRERGETVGNASLGESSPSSLGG